MTDFGYLIAGDKEIQNTSLSFGLNSLTIAFFFFFAFLLLVFCGIIVFAFVCKLRVVSLLGIICSIMMTLVSLLIIILLALMISNANTEVEHLFSTDEIESNEITFRNKLEYEYSCCGFKHHNDTLLSCNSYASTSLSCKSTMFDPYMRVLYDLFVPIILAGICCVFIGFVNTFMFLNQKKDFIANDWGEEL